MRARDYTLRSKITRRNPRAYVAAFRLAPRRLPGMLRDTLRPPLDVRASNVAGSVGPIFGLLMISCTAAISLKPCRTV